MDQWAECKSSLDSLATMLDHIRFGVYKVDLDRFNVDTFANMDTYELLVAKVPLYKRGQQMDFFRDYVVDMIKDSVCIGAPVDSAFLKNTIGRPFRIQAHYPFEGEYSVSFKFNFGVGGCPKNNASIWDVFDNCSTLFFKINNGHLIKMREHIFIPEEQYYVE